MPITISSQAEVLGRYCATMAPEISTELRYNMVSEGVWTPVTTEHAYVSPLMSYSGNLIQAFQCPWTPSTGTGELSENNWKLRPLKIDLEWTCDELMQWYDQFMCSWYELGSGKDLTEWEFPRWLFRNQIYPQIQNDMEMTIAYKANYLAPTSGTPGLTINAVDGLGTAITDGLALPAGAPNSIPVANRIATGAFTVSTTYDKIKAFIEGLPELARDKVRTIYCSKAVFDMYVTDVYERFGQGGCCDLSPISNPNLASVLKTVAVFPYNVRLVPLPSMTGSQRIIAEAMPGNIIWGRRTGESSLPTFQWKSEIRTLRAWADFHRFYGFKDGRFLFVNDQV